MRFVCLRFGTPGGGAARREAWWAAIIEAEGALSECRVWDAAFDIAGFRGRSFGGMVRSTTLLVRFLARFLGEDISRLVSMCQRPFTPS